MPRRRCACGCGEALDPNASLQTKYRPRHRQRKYQRRRDAEAREALAERDGLAAVKTTARRGGSSRRRRTRVRSLARYAVVQIEGPTIEILGFDVGRSRRAVEGAFGIRDRDDLAAVAERYLPITA